ncbi:PRC-barrel domain-containing protein [Paractinoplanes rishiriensis]|uniref:PRC-barrel domain-containing protein n=1 Tax=Paractinoplanes rishiriensis TaxID=1050105 RepID=A0A919KAG5_9ACTN|nr:PRC-barrel domain-containing protein [Actinoplanes rishiriensis]GIF01861.1 hypothetical protein Ari01nite_93250 [Actinoplanes rishiriensis]
MSLLVRATELVKRPVVTLAGDDVAQIKDVVYDASGGAVSGFTLNGRGIFASPLKQALPLNGIRAIGRDAVIISSTDVLTGRDEVAEAGDVRDRNVLGNRVVTDTGTDLGTVVDVILQVGNSTDVVGYEIEAGEALSTSGQRVLLPLPDALSVSGEALVVPAGATEFVAHDLAGFGAAVAAFRTHLKGGADAVQ